MTGLQRFALWFQKYTTAESSHEQVLGWWLKVYWRKFWQVKRQVVIEPYKYRLDLAIIDGPLKVAVEADGRHWHRMGDKPRKDADRDEYLERIGWHVVRINDDLIETNPRDWARAAANYARVKKSKKRKR